MHSSVFESDCHETVTKLKSALIELYDAGSVDPNKPQDAARQLGINKTLTWSISRFLESSGSMVAVSFVPGASSIAKVVEAFPSSPRVTEAKARVNEAALGVDAMIARHAGDRTTLDLILDNLTANPDDRLELSRRLSFRGQSGICGVQAKTRLSTWFLAPSASDPTLLDMAAIRGCVRVRRLRPNVQWPIFKMRFWGFLDNTNETHRWEPLDRTAPNGVPLMTEFCRGDIPQVDATNTEQGRDYVMRSGEVGNTGAFDCFAGEIMRSEVGRYATPEDQIGEVGMVIAMPCESIVIDLLYHRDLDFVSQATSILFSEVIPHGQRTPGVEDSKVLPIHPRLVALAGSPPAVATPLVPRYSEMVQRVFDRTGWNPSEFAGVRVEMEYPPLHSQLMIRFPLPVAK